MQIVLKTPKGPVALPRWMPLLLLAELVVVLLVLLRGMGTEQDLTFSPAQLTNQYAETLTLTTGTDGSVTPDEARTTRRRGGRIRSGRHGRNGSSRGS